MTKSPLSYNHQYAKIDGYKYHYVDEGPKTGQLIVLVHGWPELWLTYKNQINFLSNLGYRVIAVDLIGIGESEGPKVIDKMNKEAPGLEKYTIKSNCKVLNYLVKSVLKTDKAIFIGHDWGSMVIWRMSQYYPDVVKALGSVCIHYSPPSKNFVELDDKIKFVPSLEYQRDIAYKNFESECNQHKKLFFEAIYQYNDWKPEVPQYMKDIREGRLRLTDILALDKFNKSIKLYSPVFTEEEFQYICDKYTPQVISNSCNYYRSGYLNYLDEKDYAGSLYIDKPVLMIHASDDITNFIYKHAGKEPATRKFCSRLTLKNIEGDHWIQLNRSDEVNQTIATWLNMLKSSTSKL